MRSQLFGGYRSDVRMFGRHESGLELLHRGPVPQEGTQLLTRVGLRPADGDTSSMHEFTSLIVNSSFGSLLKKINSPIKYVQFMVNTPCGEEHRVWRGGTAECTLVDKASNAQVGLSFLDLAAPSFSGASGRGAWAPASAPVKGVISAEASGGQSSLCSPALPSFSSEQGAKS
jgi:hypothetical protein